MRAARARALLALGVLVGLLGTAATAAGGDERERFQQRHAEVVREWVVARERQQAAELAYKHVRLRERGEKKAAVLAEREAAAEALAAAERAVETFEAQARRDGIPPGWMRDNPLLRDVPPPASP